MDTGLDICNFLFNHFNALYGDINPKNSTNEPFAHQGKKEEIWLSPKTKAPTPAEMSKGQGTTESFTG